MRRYLEKCKLRQKRAKEHCQKKRRKRARKGQKKGKKQVLNSPSYITEYEPVLDKISHNKSPQVTPLRGRTQHAAIARGIERMHLHDQKSQMNDILAKRRSRDTSTDSSSSTTGSESSGSEEERAKAVHQAAKQMVVDSEQFKATATALPEGKSPYDYNNDGDFMMSTCHVEPTISEKAEQGKFVDLEKLRNKSLKELMRKDSGKFKLDFVTKEGQSYVVVADQEKNSKITSYSKWEQAFKVYMTGFCLS